MSNAERESREETRHRRTGRRFITPKGWESLAQGEALGPWPVFSSRLKGWDRSCRTPSGCCSFRTPSQGVALGYELPPLRGENRGRGFGRVGPVILILGLFLLPSAAIAQDITVSATHGQKGP